MKPTRFQSTDTNIIEVERDGDSKQADMFKVERDGPTKKDNIMVGGKEPVTKKAVKRTTLAVQAAEEPMAKPDDEKEDCSDKDSSDEEEKPAAKAAPANPVDEKEESSYEDNITEDIDVWKVSIPTKSNPEKHGAKPAATAATTQTLNSKKTSTRPGTGRPAPRPGTRRPAQDLAQDNQHKIWHQNTSSHTCTTSEAPT